MRKSANHNGLFYYFSTKKTHVISHKKCKCKKTRYLSLASSMRQSVIPSAGTPPTEMAPAVLPRWCRWREESPEAGPPGDPAAEPGGGPPGDPAAARETEGRWWW